ncbi:uncharacterized protein METZ01_LOCUS437925, partial [marine metagenome]
GFAPMIARKSLPKVHDQQQTGFILILFRKAVLLGGLKQSFKQSDYANKLRISHNDKPNKIGQ